ncbi:MAG: hypothetical protein WAW20_02020, partial [Anaerolineae bacterium]
MDSSERLIDEQLIERLNVLSVGISMIDMENALALMEHWIAARQRAYVCVCTVHTVMECQYN